MQDGNISDALNVKSRSRINVFVRFIIFGFLIQTTNLFIPEQKQGLFFAKRGRDFINYEHDTVNYVVFLSPFCRHEELLVFTEVFFLFFGGVANG